MPQPSVSSGVTLRRMRCRGRRGLGAETGVNDDENVSESDGSKGMHDVLGGSTCTMRLVELMQRSASAAAVWTRVRTKPAFQR